MCGFGKNKISKDKFMSFELFKNIINNIGRYSNTIRLNGRGESTIHPNFLEMLKYVKYEYPDKNITLFSNFSFSDEKIIESFIKYNVQLFISVDSPFKKELEDIRVGCDFDKIISNIKLLKDIEKRPYLVFTIQEVNINQIYDIAKFAKKYNLNLIYNTVRRDEGIEVFIDIVKSNIDKLREEFKKVKELFLDESIHCLIPTQISGINIGLDNLIKTNSELKECPALNNELCVLYNGDVTPCNMFNPYIYGNLFNDSIEKILNNNQTTSFKKDYKNYYYCKNCACLGGN